MDDSPELTLKTICCGCLSRDRRLYQLCRVKDGVNCLYYLISYDPEAYMEGFFKNPTSLYICWECKAIIYKILKFRAQVCDAQRKLNIIAEGREDVKYYPTLSRLTKCNKLEFTIEITTDNEIDNFIDCGPIDKSESDDDIPLAELSGKDDKSNIPILNETKNRKKTKPHKIKKEKLTLKNVPDSKEYYTIESMNDDEIKKFRMQIKMAEEFINKEFKCESCLKTYENKRKLDSHNRIFHLEKPKHAKCDICLSYIKNELFTEHCSDHFNIFSCKMCETTCLNKDDVISHIKCHHRIRIRVKDKCDDVENNYIRKPVERKTALGYQCSKCNKCFTSHKARWNHMQQYHTEGHRCEVCGKRFAFTYMLAKHRLNHETIQPREKCLICHKMIRVDLFKSHNITHTKRESFKCIQCDKMFVSRPSYEYHLKYSSAHTKDDLRLRFKCPQCDKRYRAQREMQDHYNYHHLGKTEHKCPICGKAIATRRCIARHVRRAHDGIVEGKLNKICQQCGKGFRDKKNLREHELTHTGERPLSCEVCGCTFRQTASLYTHKKRVHNICPEKKKVDLIS